MRTRVPVAIAFIMGTVMAVQFFVPTHQSEWLKAQVPQWARIVGAFALVVGLFSLVKVNLDKTRRRAEGWPFAIVTLVGLFAMMGLGIPADTTDTASEVDLGLHRAYDPARQWVSDRAQDPPSDTVYPAVYLTIGSKSSIKPGQTTVSVTSEDGSFAGEADLTSAAGWGVEASPTVWVSAETAPADADNRAGEDPLKYRYVMAWETAPADASIANLAVSGALEFSPAWRTRLETGFQWLYDNVQVPMDATIFSLLAFFIASAAYRTFRARTLEAGLLLAAAMVVMVGRVPLGVEIGAWFHEHLGLGTRPDWLASVTEWIMNFPSMAAMRAIKFGAALAAVAQALRIIVGIERPYMSGS